MAHHLSISHGLTKGGQRQVVLQAPFQIAQSSGEPGNQAAAEFPEAPVLWIGLRPRFFSSGVGRFKASSGKRGQTPFLLRDWIDAKVWEEWDRRIPLRASWIF